jgi:hypothetical protein
MKNKSIEVKHRKVQSADAYSVVFALTLVLFGLVKPVHRRSTQKLTVFTIYGELTSPCFFHYVI